MTDAKAQVKTHSYHPDGQLAGIIYASSHFPTTTSRRSLVMPRLSATVSTVANPATITQRYGYPYDKAGNRVSQQVGNMVTSATHSPARSFTYDTNGNTLSDGLRTFQWDAENRLVKITQGANVHEFIYDGFSRRVAEKLNGTITKRWIWDGTRIAEQRDATGTTVQRQYFEQGEKRMGGSDAGNYYYTRDHLGSIREMTDSTAKVRARYDYDPHGVRTNLTSGILVTDRLTCDFGFTGHHYHAESNLHLTLYRAYDQELGGWLSADPIGEMGGLNLYGYVGGDPINWSDLLGLICVGDKYSENMLKKVESTKLGRLLTNAVRAAETNTKRTILIRHDPSRSSGFRFNDITLGKNYQYEDPSGNWHSFTFDQILVHELQHALDSLNNVLNQHRDDKQCSPGMQDRAEERAVKRENQYLAELLRPLRKDYISIRP